METLPVWAILGLEISDKCIRMYSSGLMQSLLTRDNTKGCDTMHIFGEHDIQRREFRSVLVKIIELQISNLRMDNIDFDYSWSVNKNNLPGMICSLRTDGKFSLRSITLNNCSAAILILQHMIPNESELNSSYLKSLTDIFVSSHVGINVDRSVMVERLKHNYRLKSVVLNNGCANDLIEDACITKAARNGKRAYTEIINEYTARNRKGHKKCIYAIISLIGVRKYRKSILSTSAKDIVLIICRMICESSGAKIWIDNSSSQ